MPSMSGAELYQALRRHKSDVKILLCSGYNIDHQAQALIQQGAHGFMQKPYNLADLSRKLSELLRRQ